MNPTALGEQELDRLESLLDDPSLEEAMRLDEIQAYLCAAATGPEPRPVDEALAVIFGEGDDSPVRDEATALVVKIAAHLDATLADDQAAFSLWLYPLSENENAPMDFGPWCMAYLHGIDDAPSDWFDDLDDEEADFLDQCIYPMLVLSGEAEAAAREHREPWPEGDELAELTRDCEEALPTVVEDIHRFWLAKRGPRTVRHETPKAGRNDPCPCGSGKKYKQCCGR